MEKKNDSEKSKDDTKKKLKKRSWNRRDFIKATGVTVAAGIGAVFAPGIGKASVWPRSLRNMESSGQALTTLPEWKPYPYKVIPLPVLDAKIPKGFFTYLMDYDKVIPIYVGAFFIEGVKGHNILVDSGPTKKDFAAKGYPCKVIKPMREALLDATGHHPEDIDILILTHLHHDHNPLTSIYKNAKVIVQKTEWNSMHNPPACFRHLYNPEYMMGVTPTFVNGDVWNLVPGVSLLFTPGHTIGNQSVVIDTKLGRLIISGTCCLEENFNPPENVKQFWPDALVPGLHIDSQQAYESLTRIKREADFIITPHDRKSYDRGAGPTPKWPKLGSRRTSFGMYRSDAPKSDYTSID